MSKLNYNKIKETLANKGRKNVELASYIGVDPRTVSSWCSNSNQPEYETLFKIAEFLKVEAGDLLTLKKDLRNIKNKKTILIKTKSRKNKK
jgi:transcriptional regulator with XRE-family HTH domain